jgi:hypothetical protein
MRGFVRVLTAAAAAAALVALASLAPAGAAPGGIPGSPDQPGTGEPPVAGVVRPLTTGESNSAKSPGGSVRTNNLKYGGGSIQTAPKVYLVFWGSQWSQSDPVATYLLGFLRGIGGGETWSTSTTQYCQGIATGSTTCPVNSVHVGHPSTTPLVDYWFDNTAAAPSGASQTQLAAEARKAATHFSSAVLGPDVQFVIATPANARPQGFGTSYCAWHSYTSSTAVGTIAYTNLPYIPAVGATCGQNFVNSGTAGALDGVSIVEGHEYAETVTDPFINAWKDQQGAENGDKCAWISAGQPGASANVPLGGTQYAVQSLWSNIANGGAGGCVIS